MRVLPQTLGTALPHKHRRIIPPKEPITPALCQRSRTVLRRSPAFIPRRGWNDRAVSANSLQRVVGQWLPAHPPGQLLRHPLSRAICNGRMVCLERSAYNLVSLVRMR
jgi:hypothetical protein